MDDSALARVERQRVELEEQITQFKKLLRHWQTLEIEYEGLREEFYPLSENCSIDDALAVAREFAPELIVENEIRELFAVGKGARRTPRQVVDQLSRRIDYVSKNVFTVKRQLSDAERKRNALLLAEEPGFRDEAGLPLTEFTEEFDEYGNVLSTKLETAESAANGLMEVLKKAGVKDLIEDGGVVTAASQDDHSQSLIHLPPSPVLKEIGGHGLFSPPGNGEVPQSGSEKVAKDSVTLVPRQTHTPIDTRLSGAQRTHKTGQNGQLVEEHSLPLVDDTAYPTHPDDTEEEAILRREMLDYGMGEVGAIVAQLDLEEDGSDMLDENDDLFLESDLEDESEEDASEDENGATKHPIISDEYRKKMERLERKLGLKHMQNLGPERALPGRMTEESSKPPEKPPAAELARKAAIARAEAATNASSKVATSALMTSKATRKFRKKVSFADDLDVAPEPTSRVSPSDPVRQSHMPPVSDSILERDLEQAASSSSSPCIFQPKKVSLFKAARVSKPQTAPFSLAQVDHLPLLSETLAMEPSTNEVTSMIVKERPIPGVSSDATPLNPDDIDEALHRKEIAGEFHRLRNKMIHRQGGFIRGGESDNYGDSTAPIPMVDEETGKIKKISRFMAARLQ